MSTASNLKLRCTCGSIFSVARELIGKLGQCKKCGAKFRIPDRKRSETVPATKAELKRQIHSNPAPANKTVSKARVTPCPSCHSEMGRGTTVCISCGFHTKLRKRLKSFDGIDSNDSNKSGANFTASVALFPLAALAIILSWLCQGNVNGPTYLGYYFTFFVIVGSLVPLVRRFLWDVDAVNHAAILATVGVGAARIVDSVAHGKYKLLFLITAMVIALCLFLVTKTNRNQHRNSVFVDAFGGMVLWTYYSLFLVATLLIAGVFFVGPVGYVVIRVAGLIILLLIGLVGAVCAWIADLPPGQRFTDWANSLGHSSSSWSDCSSSCGGGGCAGGCGGCGGD